MSKPLRAFVHVTDRVGEPGIYRELAEVPPSGGNRLLIVIPFTEGENGIVIVEVEDIIYHTVYNAVIFKGATEEQVELGVLLDSDRAWLSEGGFRNALKS